MNETIRLMLVTSSAMAVFAFSAIVAKGQDCQKLVTGSACGAPSQYANCTNSCQDIGYSINSQNETCTDLSEDDDCGVDTCNTSSVTIWKYYGFATESIINGKCFFCTSPETWWPMINAGKCEQDSIPTTALECGPNCPGEDD